MELLGSTIITSKGFSWLEKILKNIQRKTWCMARRMGPYARVDYNSHYLLVNSVVSYPSHCKGKWVGWGIFLQLVEYIGISKTTNRTREKGEGKG
jgi:hypothetical protein